MAMPLPGLPLEALRGPQDEQQHEGGNLPAALSRTTVQLCFVSRNDVFKLQDLELELQRAWRRLPSSPPGAAAAEPSILRGCFVRFVSSGSYHISRVARSWEETRGELMLELEGFGRPVPAACLSKTNPLADAAEWEQHGRKEVEELARTLAARLPLQREIAAACCRLSTAWLWAAQREAFTQAVQRDPAAVAAALEDAELVAALLPCVQPPPPRVPSTKQSTQAAAEAAAAGGAPAAAQGGPPAKRQRIGSAAGTANVWQQQQQQVMQPLAQPAHQPALQQQQQQPQQVVQPVSQPAHQPASQQPAAPQAPRAAGAAAVLLPGSRLLDLMLRGVAAGQCSAQAYRHAPYSYCTLAALGSLLDKLDRNWRLLAQGCPLKRLARELCERGLLAEGPPHPTGGVFRLSPAAGQLSPFAQR